MLETLLMGRCCRHRRAAAGVLDRDDPGHRGWSAGSTNTLRPESLLFLLGINASWNWLRCRFIGWAILFRAS
jgi:hypothetical protein